MSFTQIPEPYDLEIFHGDDVTIPFIVKQDGELVDLTNYTLTAVILTQPDVINMTVTKLNQVHNKGQFNCSLTDTITSTLSGYYQYEISYVNGSVNRTIVKGRLHVDY
jgi:hypothetical protein